MDLKRAASIVINNTEDLYTQESINNVVAHGYPVFTGFHREDRFSKKSIVGSLTAFSIDMANLWLYLSTKLNHASNEIEYIKAKINEISANMHKSLSSVRFTGNLRLLSGKFENFKMLFYDNCDAMENSYEYGGLLIPTPGVSKDVSVSEVISIDGIYEHGDTVYIPGNTFDYIGGWISRAQKVRFVFNADEYINNIFLKTILPIGAKIKSIETDVSALAFDDFEYFGTHVVQFTKVKSPYIDITFELSPIRSIYGFENITELINTPLSQLLSKRESYLYNLIPSNLGGTQTDSGELYLLYIKDVSFGLNTYVEDGYAYFNIPNIDQYYCSENCAVTDTVVIRSDAASARMTPVRPALLGWNDA